MRSGTEAQRGAALFIVLLFAALLSGLAAVAMRNAMSGARAAAVFANGIRADELGRAAADVVAYQVATGSPEQRRGGSLEVRLAQGDLTVDYVSESARIDVNAAPLGLISALLAATGADPELVAAVASRIAAFRALSGGPKPPSAATGPVTLPNPEAQAEPVASTQPPAPGAKTLPQIQRTTQVTHAWGLPEALAERVLPALTVANRSATVDPVLAGRLVLSALMAGDQSRVDDYIERRGRGFVNAEAALALIPPGARAFASVTDASAVRAIARVTVGSRFQRRYEVVLDPPQVQGQDPKILSWQPML